MIRAIISDLDGTILPRGGSVSEETLAAFRRAGEQGCTRIIATGRSLHASLQVLSPNFPIDYLVFSSGAGILRFADREILFARHLPREEARRVAEYLWNHNLNFTIRREIPDNHYFYYTNLYPLHPDYKQHLTLHAPFGTEISSPDEIRDNATQVIVILSGSQLQLMQKIKQDLKTCSVVRSTSPVDNRAIWLEIFAPNINKGTTCRHLLSSLAISCEHTAGIGNDYNDVDFLDICAASFLVANAPGRLKPHYKAVASVKDNGFSEFINRIL